MNNPIRLLIIFLISGVVLAAACRYRTISPSEVWVVPGQTVTIDPNDGVWYSLPYHPAKLILQDMVEPRLMEASVQEVEVTAMTDGKEIAYRLEWVDESQNDTPGPQSFMDGCAVQIPGKIDANVPAPQMGEETKAVDITFWRADWQAIVDGRADDIRSIHPNAAVDHYPFDAKSLEKDPKAKAEMAKRYAPARALGNGRSGPRKQPVEDLLAEGPGTLTPAKNVSKGRGVRTAKGWAVVIVRPVPQGFSNEKPSNIAFAVWEGTHKEAGARKMRTGWVPLVQKEMK